MRAVSRRIAPPRCAGKPSRFAQDSLETRCEEMLEARSRRIENATRPHLERVSSVCGPGRFTVRTVQPLMYLHPRITEHPSRNTVNEQFSPFSAFSLCGMMCGMTTLDNYLHFFLSWTHFSFICHAFNPFLTVLLVFSLYCSTRQLLCLHFFPSLLMTWASLLLLIMTAMFSTLASFNMSSFLQWSCWPLFI